VEPTSTLLASSRDWVSSKPQCNVATENTTVLLPVLFYDMVVKTQERVVFALQKEWGETFAFAAKNKDN